MENFIREKSTQVWVETRKAGKLTRKAETDTIQKLVEYAKVQGSSHAEMLYMTYSKLANKMAGINKRDEATVMQLNNLSLMEILSYMKLISESCKENIIRKSTKTARRDWRQLKIWLIWKRFERKAHKEAGR